MLYIKYIIWAIWCYLQIKYFLVAFFTTNDSFLFTAATKNFMFLTRFDPDFYTAFPWIYFPPFRVLNNAELHKYYARLQTAVARGLGLPVYILTLLPNTHSVIAAQFLSPISSNVSSVGTWRRLTFLFFTEPVSLNLLTCLLIVLGLGTGRPGNFTRNLRRVSEHNFLLFIYVLWIYTRSHNENSCLGMLQITVITITTLTVLTSNSNHNQ